MKYTYGAYCVGDPETMHYEVKVPDFCVSASISSETAHNHDKLLAYTVECLIKVMHQYKSRGKEFPQPTSLSRIRAIGVPYNDYFWPLIKFFNVEVDFFDFEEKPNVKCGDGKEFANTKGDDMNISYSYYVLYKVQNDDDGYFYFWFPDILSITGTVEMIQSVPIVAKELLLRYLVNKRLIGKPFPKNVTDYSHIGCKITITENEIEERVKMIEKANGYGKVTEFFNSMNAEEKSHMRELILDEDEEMLRSMNGAPYPMPLELAENVRAFANKSDKDDLSEMIYLIEECSELQKELTKQLRGKGDITNICEEIADVYITLNHVREELKIPCSSIQLWMDYKMKREGKKPCFKEDKNENS